MSKLSQHSFHFFVGMPKSRRALGTRPARHDPVARAGRESAPAAQRGVLIMNPKSGGGKAERFGLEALCRERGIEPIVLTPGSDLLALAEDACLLYTSPSPRD